MRYTYVVLLVMMLAVVPTSLAEHHSDSIVDVAVGVNEEGGEFDTLIAALGETPFILRLLDSPYGEYTVFAPTDEAFEKLGLDEDNIGDVDRRTLAKILLYHVDRGEMDAEEVLSSERLRMLNGQILEQDDGVLTTTTGGESRIIQTDVQADNGVIHVIDSVLVPRGVSFDETGSIIDVAVAVNEEGGEFDTLIAALGETPFILRLLDSPYGEYTVFAPTDEAFEKLGLDEDNIGDVDRRTLAKILLYHVDRGEMDAEEVLSSERLRMLNGQILEQDDGVLTTTTGGESRIIQTDVQADNGVIHVIDSVLVPRGVSFS